MSVQPVVRTVVSIAMTVLIGCATSPAPSVAVRYPTANSAPIGQKDPPIGLASQMSEWESSYRQRCEPYEGDPRTWRAQPPSDGDAPYMMQRYSYCNWVVSQSTGGLTAAAYFPKRVSRALPFEPSVRPKYQVLRCAGDDSPRNDPELAVRDYLQTEDGFLVAYASGEWGGGLYWFDSNGTLVESITEQNTYHLIDTPHGILAFVGIAHLMTDEGRVLRLTRQGNRWNVDSVTLPGAPSAVLSDDGDVIVATTKHLLRITPLLTAETIHHGIWRSPSSIVRDVDGTFYLGNQFAVIRLKPTIAGYFEEWLAPVGAQRQSSQDTAG